MLGNNNLMFSDLQSFIHVSTAFTNCHLQEVDEKFYPPPTSAEHLVELAGCVRADLLDQITPVSVYSPIHRSRNSS